MQIFFWYTLDIKPHLQIKAVKNWTLSVIEGTVSIVPERIKEDFLQSAACSLQEQFSKHTLAPDRKDKKMAINPMKLLELKNLWSAFTRRHPKFPQFISAVQQAGISEGTVIEVQITTPDGRTFTSNLKVQPEDIEAVKSLQNYQ